MPEHKTWTMPEWMEPYRDLFQNTGGDTIENLMNERSANVRNNVIRAALCVSVASQVDLLTRMHQRGMLASSAAD